MDYKKIVKSSFHNDEDEMWNSVDRINAFLDILKEEQPEKVKRFLKQEYEALNGRHLNEDAARTAVSGMFHTEGEGDNRKVVRGEAVTPQDAMTLLEGMGEEEKKAYKWDAYAGANGYVHDLAKSGFSRNQILNAAKHFWFHDDDFSDGGKVYWYYSRMLF